MSELLLRGWSHQLRRRDLWVVSALGLIMIASLTLLLSRIDLLSQLAELGGFIELIRRTLPADTRPEALGVLKTHLVRSGLFLAHFTLLAVTLLTLLGDPLERTRIARPLLALPVARWKIFAVQNTAVVLTVIAFGVPLGLLAGYNARLAQVYRSAFWAGFLGVFLKLVLLVGWYRLIAGYTGPGLGVVSSFFLYGVCHLNGTFGRLAETLPGMWGWGAQLLHVVLPAFDRIGPSAPSWYGPRPSLILLDAMTWVLYALFFFGGGLLLFVRRDL